MSAMLDDNLAQRHRHGEAWKRVCGAPPRPLYTYLLNDSIQELYRIPVDVHAALIVEGNPEWGQYEWRIEGGADDGKHSDCGYGDAAIALRDGLIAYHGLPETVVA